MNEEMQKMIEAIIQEAILEVNAQLEENKRILFNENIRFIGKDACLDSMGLATFILTIEELLEDKMDKKVQLVSDKAFSSKQSPFYSVSTLVQYIYELISVD